ncbi:RNA methyltransferase [Marivirga tractuosa]|uniref:tRNA/rRNA methyltransferase (SpoU) n=1 Tax=Marivirga tractuosa (strain ATCC 23168 / DSM 4126 / NBRC 15989 / NCIMB 1408 / VKM B-1430 / H-43) TaxID=643867 RepID=E4TPG1_MARTH|nr:RNA methyltransferase [Marivirga tractuosa]ADR21549.1 tRNA/rRNA methyltransferase (SpoU) [Marivirga tractuosa DSM 4126]BDD13996.1 RNA methyltransferase [Marivirga tractuosa]
MLTKNNTKFIKSLQLKKFRQKEELFIVEGAKNTLELLNSSYKLKYLIVSEDFLSRHQKEINSSEIEPIIVKEKELSALGAFQSNTDALAVVHEKAPSKYDSNGFDLVLDDIRDPGNLGTIIRLADWYGIKNIICSETTAEFYNPKVISASMGSIFRTNLYRRDLKEFLGKNQNRKIYGALLEGKNVHQVKFEADGLLVIGNESHGIQKELIPLISEKVTIPKIGQAESLNAAMATAIICDNVYRNK